MVADPLDPERDNSDDDEDDIQEVGGMLQDINCPITLTPLVDPQTSWAYSLPCTERVTKLFILDRFVNTPFPQPAIRQVLGPNRFTKRNVQRLASNQMICLNDLKPNKELERRVKAHQRRAQRREEDHDAEEIVE